LRRQGHPRHRGVDFLHQGGHGGGEDSLLHGSPHQALSEQSLVATISLSIYHFEVLAAVCRELADLRNTLESRKMVDRAKGILMNRTGMSETQAHARLQELASSRNMKMATVADLIVEAELVFSRSIS